MPTTAALLQALPRVAWPAVVTLAGCGSWWPRRGGEARDELRKR